MTALFFCLENEQMCGAGLHRGEAATRGTPHLPSACLNEVTEVGWPAVATPVRFDPTPLFPDLYDHETREARLEASRKWKAANRERVLASDREYQRRRRAARRAP